MGPEPLVPGEGQSCHWFTCGFGLSPCFSFLGFGRGQFPHVALTTYLSSLSNSASVLLCGLKQITAPLRDSVFSSLK